MGEVIVGSESLDKKEDVTSDRIRAEVISDELSLAIYYNLVSGSWEIVQFKRMTVVYSGSLGYICDTASKLSQDTSFIPDKEEIRSV